MAFSTVSCDYVLVCQGTQWVLLTAAEVKERFVVIEERKKRIIENKLRAQLREEKRQKSEELLSKLAEARLQRKMEQQGLCHVVVYQIHNSIYYLPQ